MRRLTVAPDISGIDIPIDQWTAPFWASASRRELVVPRCGACGSHRWPAGPFCPNCQSQAVDWVPAGQGYIYSFTLVTGQGADCGRASVAPGLIEFPSAGGVRMVGAIVEAPTDTIAIGAAVDVMWRPHGSVNVPVFRLVDG